MDRIASFTINHDALVPGFYVSRRDGDITTYDARFVKPNTPPFLSTGEAHTIEHIVATYLRNSPVKEKIIYFGPMGCRTGFYLITRDLPDRESWKFMREAISAVSIWQDEIPGASKIECGNYLDQDLDGARIRSIEWLNNTPSRFSLTDLIYPE